jgi:hypothetical protein
MDRFDDSVRRRREKAVDLMRARNRFRFRPAVALELSPDAGEAGQRPIIINRELDDVLPPAGEDLYGVVVDLELDAIAVELDFMDPPIAGRHFLDRGRQRGLDESGEGRLRANCRSLFALKRHNKTPRH